jgi:hypothetical protein
LLLSFSFVACLPVGSVLRIDRHDGESQVLSTVAGEGNSGSIKERRAKLDTAMKAITNGTVECRILKMID